MTELKIYRSRWKAFRLILICSVFIVAGVFLIMQSDSKEWLGWLSLIFFGLGLPVGAFQFFDRRPQIIVNEIGIFDRNIHHEFINWNLIQDSYLRSINRQKFICLVVDEKFEPSPSKGKLHQSLSVFSKALGFRELNISLGSVNVDSNKLMEIIQVMREAARIKASSASLGFNNSESQN